MNNQAIFSSKDKSKKLKCRLLQFLFGALKVKCFTTLLPNTLTYFVEKKREASHIFSTKKYLIAYFRH